MAANRIFPALVAIALAAVATPSLAQNAPPPDCVLPNKLETRIFDGGDTFGLWLQRDSGSAWNLCLRFSGCYWSVDRLEESEAEGFGDYARTNSDFCPSTYDKKQYIASCTARDPLLENTALLRRAFRAAFAGAPHTLCSVIQSSRRAGFVHRRAGAAPAILMDAPIGQGRDAYCVALLLRTSDLAALLLVLPRCPTRADAPALVDRALSAAQLQKKEVWAGGAAGAVVFLNKLESKTSDQVTFDSAVVVVGKKAEKFRDWLAAVSKAAQQANADPIQEGAPLGGAVTTSEPLGRAFNWFAAAVARLEAGASGSLAGADERSVRARDWMTQNVLSRRDEFKDTLFRVELMD